MNDLTGTTLGKYKLYARIGSGGMARVYKAYQPSLDRYVAVKVMHAHLAEEDEFVQRFEREAASVARLRHPHIVQVYDFAVENELYYMVMEFIAGPTLNAELDVRSLSDEPFTLEETSLIITNLASAIDYAHVRGMIHRDIKPANIMFTNEGQIVLADFGIARMRGTPTFTMTGMIAGTPAYMSPEQARAKRGDTRSDIYSLGVILYEMITGRQPFTSDSPIDILRQQAETPLPPPASFKSGIPPAVEEVLYKVLEKEPDDRYQTAGDLARALQQATGLTSYQLVTAVGITTIAEPPQVDDEPFTPVRSHFVAGDMACPYRGLYKFREEDASVFYGREAFTERLQTAVANQPFVAVMGPSGSGKSSVVFAGLIPELRQEDGWLIIPMRPENQPFRALANALVPYLEPDMSQTDQSQEQTKLAQGLADGVVQFNNIIQRILTRSPEINKILLVIDQFEELYTLCPNPEIRTRFLDVLLDMADIQSFQGDPSFRLVITLRTDFLSQALTHREFADALQDNDIKLGPMTRRELSRAIANPARKQGVLFETGLVARILDDVGHEPGNLPLLEFALTELWEKPSDGRLSHEGYTEIGGVEGALARYADEEYGKLNETQQEQAHRIFIQMVRPGAGTEDTRRPATRSELGRENWQLVQTLADKRLVVTSRNPAGEETVEVVHEALIRGWGQLRQWMAEDRSFRAWQDRLRAALRQWQMSDQDEAALLRGAILAEAEGWLVDRQDYLSQEEIRYIEASLHLRQQQQERSEQERLERERAAATQRYARRLTWLAIALAIAIIVALVLAISAINSNRDAQFAAATARDNEAAAISAQETAVTSQQQADAARATAEADANARATAEAAARNQQATAEAAAQEALNARATSDANAIALATANSIALANEDEAEKTAREVRSRELAGIALRQLGSDPPLSLLLGLEAVNIPQTEGDIPPPAAENALQSALQAIQLKRTLTGHTGSINDIAYSPDGRRIATVSSDTDVKIWDAATGQEIITLESGHARPVNALAFSPNGKLLATGGDDFVILWNAESGERITVFNRGVPIQDITFSADSIFIAVASEDKDMQIWDVSKRQSVALLEGHDAPITGVAYSPDGQYLASSSADGRIIVRSADALKNPDTGGIQYAINAVLDEESSKPIVVTSIRFNPDSTQLITGHSNGLAKIWDAATGELVATLSGHASQVNDAVFSPDGQFISTAGADGTAKVWDADTHEALFTISQHTGGVTAVAFSPDGERLATASQDSTAKIWDTQPGLTPQIITGPRAAILALAFNDDGSLIAAAGDDKAAWVWQTGDNQRLYQFRDHSQKVNALAFQPGGSLLATASDDHIARLWDMNTEEIVLPLLAHPDKVNDLAFIADGAQLVTVSADGVIRFWDVLTHDLGRTIETETPINAIRFSADESHFATAMADGTAVVRDTETGDIVWVFAEHEGAVNDVAFSPDGTLLATAGNDNTIKIWDLEIGQVNKTLTGHTGAVQSVAFSQDGARLASASLDNTVKLWDIASGDIVRDIIGHTGPVNSVQFSLDGRILATASTDRTIRLNTLETIQTLFDRALRLLPRLRYLSPDECEQYLDGDDCLTLAP
ncbi:MAG TPA: hypothetical protein EYP41_16790 [Anaerolineae bacterium]|nr:hypothetical protein [Anaerolineae bacterium]